MNRIIWKLENKKVSELKEFAKNPRRLTEKGLKDLESSIKKFGIAEPIVVNADNMIVGGHGRKRVLEKLKIEQVDCYVPNRLLDDKEVDELCVRLNKNIAGEFDFDILANEFEMDDLLEWGFEEFELGGIGEEEPEIEVDIFDDVDVSNVNIIISCDQLDLVNIINDIEKIKKNYKNFKIKIDESIQGSKDK